MNSLKPGHSKKKKEKALKPIKEIEEETIRMNVNIPKTLHKQLKQNALDKDITVTEIVIKVLNDYLNK